VRAFNATFRLKKAFCGNFCKNVTALALAVNGASAQKLIKVNGSLTLIRLYLRMYRSLRESRRNSGAR
jgi:hypothetical protein